MCLYKKLKSIFSKEPDNKVFTTFFLILFFFTLIKYFIDIRHGIYSYIPGNGTDSFHVHDFRQSQTALTTLWMIKESNLLNWELPVFGYPWGLILELPIYQMTVASLVMLTGIDLDLAGKIISIVYFIISLPLIYSIVIHLNGSKNTAILILIFIISSPLYIFWSRAFLIESCALFFSLVYLKSYLDYINNKNNISLLKIILFGSIGVCIKITAFVYSPVFIFIYLIGIYIANKNKKYIINFIYINLLILIIFLIWQSYADHVKNANVITSQLLSSKGQLSWLSGSISDKLRILDPFDEFYKRVLTQTFGSYLTALALISLSFLSILDKKLTNSAILLLTFIIGTIIFSNVNLVHNYYQYASAWILIVASVFNLSFFLCHKNYILRFIAFIFLIVVYIQMSLYYYNEVSERQVNETSMVGSLSSIRQAGFYIKNNSSNQDLIVIHYGDWNPYLTYYSERRSLTTGNPFLPTPNPVDPVFKKLIKNAEDQGYSHKFIVFCGNERTSEFKLLNLSFFKKYEKVYSNNFCEVYQ